jgi:hypothetical protein
MDPGAVLGRVSKRVLFPAKIFRKTEKMGYLGEDRCQNFNGGNAVVSWG